MKVRTKSALSTGVLLLLVLAIGDFGRRSYMAAFRELEQPLTQLEEARLTARRLDAAYRQEVSAWKDAMLRAGSKDEHAQAMRELVHQQGRVAALLGTLARMVEHEPEAGRLVDALGKAHVAYGEMLAEAGQLVVPGRASGHALAEERSRGHELATSGLLEDLVGELEERIKLGRLARDEQLARHELWTFAILALVVLGLGAAWLLLFDRQVTRPVLEAKEMATQIAQGRFKGRVKIKGGDDLCMLLRSLQDMQQALDSRTRELVRARDTAAEANKAKTQFLRRMSHEMRTPLVGVLGNVELLLTTCLEPDQRDFVETMALSGRHLVSLIEDLLDFAQVDTDEFELARDEVDVRELVGGAVEPMVEQAHVRGLELGCMVEDSVPRRVVGDERRIRQVLAKLLSNALKFTERGGILVTVGTTARDAKGCTLRITVRDTGKGLDDRTKARVFRAFEQADVSVTRSHGGLGLGLTIARRLVDRMEGRLGFETRVGKGSAFWFELDLPVVREDDAAAVPGDALVGARVLGVSDTKVGRLILGRQVEILELEATWVEDVDEAERALREAAASGTPYHVVLLDLQEAARALPLLEKAAADIALADNRWVLMTSPLETQERGRAFALGLESVLIKPVREYRLQEALRREVLSWGISAAAGAAGEDGGGTGPGRRTRVLLVDDNKVNQRVGQRMLEKVGCIVEVAQDGQQAVERVRETGYDLILMDCHMPVLDGYQATIQIRALEPELERRHRIVAMTADGIQGTRETCIAAGMDDYALKPLQRKELDSLLARWLSLEPGAARLEAEVAVAAVDLGDAPVATEAD